MPIDGSVSMAAPASTGVEEITYLEGDGVQCDANESRARRRSKERPQGTSVVASPDKDEVQQTSASRGSSDGKSSRQLGDVWLHIYHCDPYTGFLNKVALKHAEIGIYHAGVEIFGEEWAFQYFQDTWNDPSVSGLTRCVPKCMPDYEYQESVYLGVSPCSLHEVDQCLLTLHYEWPACSYHLTKNNCLTFAEHFVKLLRAPEPFPARLKGIMDASGQHAPVDSFVDYTWGWIKWWMMRKHNQVEDEEQARGFRGGIWSSCAIPALCPGDRRTSDTEIASHPSFT